MRWAPRARPSGLRSFVMKFIFDQTVASIMNIVLFVVLINFLKGESLTRVWELVLEVRIGSTLPSYLDFVAADAELTLQGFSADHECSPQVQAHCFYSHVHGCPSGPSCSLWQWLWGDLGHLSESLCGRLNRIVLFQLWL